MVSSNILRMLPASICLIITSPIVTSFTPQLSLPTTRNLPSTPSFITRNNDVINNNNNIHPSTTLSMAGFGGGGSAASTEKNKKKKATSKLVKLKAKSQWDRYNDLKKCAQITVGVRITDTEEWMEVGRVRSENDEYTEVAIARQRALIAEHSKRLYPVQIPANAVLEWGYVTDAEGEDDGDDDGNKTWTVLDKSKGDDAPKGIEKKIGFEGISDKASGFYCYYHEGRIVEKEEEGTGGMGTRGSGFAAIKGK